MRSRLHEMCRIMKMEGADFRQTFRSASFRITIPDHRFHGFPRIKHLTRI